MLRILVSVVLFMNAVTAFAQTDLEIEKAESAKYLESLKTEPDAVVLDGGVILRPIFESGSTQYPNRTDTVSVAYHLVDRKGVVLDESITADKIYHFPLGKLIKCWQIAVPKISIGSLYKVSCPSDTAYGDKGTSDGTIKGGAALTFRIALYGKKEADL